MRTIGNYTAFFGEDDVWRGQNLLGIALMKVRDAVAAY